MAQRQPPLALVTGASSGIGEQVVRRLARRGWRTLLIARRSGRLQRLAAELGRDAPSVACRLDLADADRIGPAVTELIHTHGPVDLLVNNAGCGDYKPFLKQSMLEHRRLMEVNYFAAVALVQAVLPTMIRQRRGHVINIASMAAKVGPWGHAGYAAAKAALVNLTQTLAAEYPDQGVHFSYVNPGLVKTEFFDAPCFADMPEALRRRAVSVEEAGRRILSLVDRPRLELCIPRHYRLLDWVSAISPRLAHSMVSRRTTPAPETDQPMHDEASDHAPTLAPQPQPVEEPTLPIESGV